jgi:hypothetical protein
MQVCPGTQRLALRRFTMADVDNLGPGTRGDVRE